MFSVFIVMIGSLGLLLSFSICTHSLVSFKIPSSRIAGRNHFSRLDMSGRKDENDQAINPTPISILKSYQNFGSNSIRAATILASSLLSVYSKTSPISLPVQSANAIGTLAELQNQACVLQDISFNVYDCNVEATAISALTLNTYQALSTVGGADGLTRIVAGFGPNGYVSPPTFYPGISSFFEDGGHATITYQQRPNADTLAVPGNGLQYVKLATEQLRLSKGIENGKYITSTMINLIYL